MKQTVGKILYGALFAAVVPALLALWAASASDVVGLPPLHAPAAGAAVTVLGVILILSAMRALWVHGGGLPMNAFPPPRFVTRGPFAVVAHPIYVGFVIACAGVSIAVGSASGLWLVTPLAALGCVALVFGYERLDLRARFGDALPRPWLSLPASCADAPRLAQRLAAVGLVLVPWTLGYLAIAWLGPAPDARSTAFAFEARLPVLEQTELVYASTYAVVLLAPFAAPRAADLRRFMAAGLLAMALVFPLYLALPLVAPPRPFVAAGLLGRWLELERASDTPAAAFPSFHVIWALLAARCFAARGRAAAAVAWTWAAAICASCFTTGMHTLADIVAGIAAYGAVVNARTLWEAARALTERAAGSWREWRVGPFRIINHGIYAGLGSFVGYAIMAALVGREHAWVVGLVAMGGLMGSALWAQLVEGSARLARPFGFFGGLLGMCLCALAAPRLGVSTWNVLGAACVAGPVTQSLGRVRCLVQGCCHGSQAPGSVGIRYVHPRSRVTRLSDLGGIPLHPTQLYSILWNVVIELAMARLWMVHARLHLIGGLYLVLMGLGRFVEEAYRGEPQTQIVARLRLYQWISVWVVAVGALCIALGRSDAAPAVDLDSLLLWPVLAPALAFGLVTWLAMGVDLPESHRRFSRLA